MPFGAMLLMSILDCRFDLEHLAPIDSVGVVFAGEDFAAGEKLILVWRLGALARLRAISGVSLPGEGDAGGFHSMRRCAIVAPKMRAKLADECASNKTLLGRIAIINQGNAKMNWVYAGSQKNRLLVGV